MEEEKEPFNSIKLMDSIASNLRTKKMIDPKWMHTDICMCSSKNFPSIKKILREGPCSIQSNRMKQKTMQLHQYDIYLHFLGG